MLLLTIPVESESELKDTRLPVVPVVTEKVPVGWLKISAIWTAWSFELALNIINVVPNPYYSYSTYEQNRVDNRVRITNLPNKCKIKIFTLNGTLIRTFDRDVTGQEDLYLTSTDFVHSKRLSYQDWDLKNQSGIIVSSGLYVIHIDVPGVGEKILKWLIAL